MLNGFKAKLTHFYIFFRSRRGRNQVPLESRCLPWCQQMYPFIPTVQWCLGLLRRVWWRTALSGWVRLWNNATTLLNFSQCNENSKRTYNLPFLSTITISVIEKARILLPEILNMHFKPVTVVLYWKMPLEKEIHLDFDSGLWNNYIFHRK